MIPPILEPIFAGIFVSIFNKYILNKCNPSVSCCETAHETADSEHEEDSSTTTSINSDIHIHAVH